MAALSGLLQAHEEGAPFSGAIIDPPILHHAHIENEQRINFFGLGGVEDAAGQKRPAFETELELAYGSPNFTSLIPAVTLWHVRSGWQVRLGVQVPVSGPR